MIPPGFCPARSIYFALVITGGRNVAETLRFIAEAGSLSSCCRAATCF